MKQIEVGSGTIDSGYRGIVYVVLHYLSDKTVTFNEGDKIAQILFQKVSLLVLIEVRDFDDCTERDTRGFESTEN